MKTKTQFLKGSKIIYNDGRAGHVNVIATVLRSDAKGMTVQFEDRMANTYISFSDRGWMDFIQAATTNSNAL